MTPPQEFWFSIDGGPPQGPLPAAGVAERIRGRTADGVRVCAVGEAAWVPLADHPAFRPPPLPDAVVPPATIPPAPRPAAQAAAPTAGAPAWMASAIGLVVLAVVGWFAYDALRPLTPREVAGRFAAADTVDEAKKYCAPAFWPVLASLDQLKGPDAGDDEEPTFTDEGTGAGQDYLVGFRQTLFDPATARRVPVTGFLTLTKADGWKVADMAFSTYDGQAAPEPISLAKHHVALLEDARKAGGVKPSGGSPRKPTPKAGGAYGLVLLVWGFLKTGGAKTVGMAVLGLIGVVYAAAKARQKPERPPPGS